jgi:predicted adenine nucleotide alpha hydrolase (AANH) superfamily ATPase
MEKPRLLLHVCCAPCSTHVIDLLRREHEVEAFFYNPNIHPEEEYLERMAESKRYSRTIGGRFHLGSYDVEDWLRRVKGQEATRKAGKDAGYAIA